MTVEQPLPTRTYLESRLRRSLEGAGAIGYTVREFLLDVPMSHHGQVSSLFSDLHKALEVERLSTRRKGYSVYVLPRYVKGRPTRPHASEKRDLDRERLLGRAGALSNTMAMYAVPETSPIGLQVQALLNEIERQFG